TADDVKRFVGELSRELSPAELDLLAAIRSDPEDLSTFEVYADWLDEHGRAGEAELVRMQCRPPDRTVLDPAAFSSHWLSHEPRAVQLRLRDVSPFMEPARRALIARPAILCP